MNDIQLGIHEQFGNKLRLRVSGICFENESILLVKHVGVGKKEFLWAPPGGGLQFGETVDECLKREFLEETGLLIEPKQFLFVNEYLEYPLHAIELFFLVEAIGGKLEKGTDPEMNAESQIIKEVGFVSFDKIQNDQVDSYHSLFKNYRSKSDFDKKAGFYQNIVDKK